MYRNLEEAIKAGIALEEERSNLPVDFFSPNALMVPEIYENAGEYDVVIPEGFLEDRGKYGHKLGYIQSGRFETVEEVQAEIRHREEVESLDDR